MRSSKPKAIKTPFQQTNAFTPQSIAGTPEAQAFLDVPIDVDPGVNERTDAAEQEVEDRWNSSFNAGVPSFVRELSRGKELRDVRSRGARERQSASYAKNALELERRRALLPQILQTGASGYNTQITQPGPGVLSSIIGGGATVGAAF